MGRNRYSTGQLRRLSRSLGTRDNAASLPMIPYFKDGVSVGNFPQITTPWDEISGICRSARVENQNYLWANSDQTTSPFVIKAHSLTNAAAAGVWTLGSETGVDVEDIASAVVNGQPYLYVADIGDNSAAHTNVYIYRIKEPVITGSNGTFVLGTDYEKITCVYQSPPVGEGGTARRDAEAIFVDPATGDMYVLTKRTTQVQLFALDHQPWGGYVGTQTLSYVGDIYQMPNTENMNSPGNGGRCVAADISPNGREIVAKNYSTVFYWPRAVGQSILNAMQQTPTTLKGYVGGGTPSSHPNNEPQGESLMFDYTGTHLYTASEYSAKFRSGRTDYPLFKYNRLPKAYTEVSFQDGVNGYSGTLDTYIDDLAGSNSTPHTSETTFICDYNTTPENRIGLLKFDVSSIPSNATIVGVDLQLHINTEGSTLQVHRAINFPWVESSVQSVIGNPAFNDVQAASVPEVYLGDFGTTLTPPGITTGAVIGGVTYGYLILKMSCATVQGWVNGSANNHGWIFYQPATSNGNGFQFRSRDHATVADRPKLTVRYYV